MSHKAVMQIAATLNVTYEEAFRVHDRFRRALYKSAEPIPDIWLAIRVHCAEHGGELEALRHHLKGVRNEA